MLIGRTGRGQEQDVAARSAARQATRFRENFGWALAYARGGCGDNWQRIGRGLGFDHRQNRLNGKSWGCRLDGKSWGYRLDGKSWGCRLDGKSWGYRLDGKS